MNNLRARREATGVSLRDMAEILNVQPSTLSRWETGNPGSHQFYRASAVLDLLENMTESILVILWMTVQNRRPR